MKMSHSRLTLRLPENVKHKLDMIAQDYSMSINDIAKFSIIAGVKVFDLGIDNFLSSLNKSDSKNPLNRAILTASAVVQKKQSDSKMPQKTPNVTATPEPVAVNGNVTGDSKNGNIEPNVTAASRERYRDIYLLNKNNIIIYNTKLQNSWERFFQHRKELRKTIKPTQLKMMWSKFEKIIEDHGVDVLSECLDRSVAHGWSGVFPPLDSQAVTSESKGGFNREDF